MQVPKPRTPGRRLPLTLAALLALAPVAAAQQAPADPEPAPAMGVITPEAWAAAAAAPIRPGELDRLIDRHLKEAGITPAPRTSDEEFLRRAYLDLTGRLPLPADVSEFLADADADKRARLIDRLLESDQYAAHWARYWRQVIGSHATDQFAQFSANAFEKWLRGKLAENAPWDRIAQEMITATGGFRFDGTEADGASFLLLAYRGPDAATDRAAEISRVFLGVQIQCAQCHDHPFDVWKRQQFHEFAAYLARLRDRPIFEEQKLRGFQLVSIGGPAGPGRFGGGFGGRFGGLGEHQMPDPENPKKTTTVHPKFLDGDAPAQRLPDDKRRQSLADAVTAKDNPWFAAAFANRVWGELMGQAFYMPIDDLGPQREAVFPDVLARLAGSFRGSDHDVKELFRAVMNTEAYQRKARAGQSAEQHVLFAGAYPTRLRADALYQSLEGVLGGLELGGPGGRFRGGFGGGFGRFGGVKAQFLKEFDVDPSTRPENVEDTISQALLMMNSAAVNGKIAARGNNLLARVLQSYPDDREAVEAVYLRAFARRPTDRELARCLAHVRDSGSRAEAFEDILWALVNSTEFQTRR